MNEGKKGLVIEGGGHRGIYSAGVLDVLLENGITADGLIGVSAGACYGANYVSLQAGRAVRYTEKYCGSRDYMGIRSWRKTGNLFNTDFCYRQLPDVLDPFDNSTFEHSPVNFYVVCTDAETGCAVYHRCETLRGEEMKWMQASASMPLVSRMVGAGGCQLLDGGVSDSIPEAAFEKLGYTRNVVVLTQPADYQKKKNTLLPLIRIMMKSYPALVHAMETRHNVYNNELADIRQKAAAGSVIVIQPSRDPDVSRTERDPSKIRALYDLGRQDALAKLPQIRRFWE